ncbi:hypothetical protein CWO92_09025 [Heyndrickxia camelliae]|uniref:1-alkyl-2-acetylglycerophosphocholine esterase n=2 Tax=Heyndrickxia camelliae TaxID=1707093 RepID=A0A2N3LL32_9BACI|nr:hypothetical protein CWO92_09025 [Heyndrickxia camelliae]
MIVFSRFILMEGSILQAERFPDDATQIATRMEDIQLVLDSLKQWNQEEFFNGIFNTNKIGVIGHSLGGATVFHLAATDKRVNCAILLDASLHVVDNKMPQVPTLNIRQEASSYIEYLNAIKDEEDNGTSEDVAKGYIEKQTEMYERLPAGSSFIKVKGAKHLSFSTIGRLISDIPSDVTATIEELIIVFLEEVLKEKQGFYSSIMNGKNRPIHAVDIDGAGLPITNP